MGAGAMGAGAVGLIVGFDGGGAKSAAVLCDGEGRILARARSGGSAIVGAPSPSFFDVVEPLLDDLARQAGAPIARVDRVVMGLSGVDYADETRKQWRAIASRLALGERLTLVNDGLVALWGASPAPRLTILQHGTGVTSAYRPEIGREAIYDSLDVAGVFDLRRAAISATARMIDGRARASLLMDGVLAHCGVAAADFAEWCLRDETANPRRASLAEVVFSAWRQGDAAAEAMVACAADDYVLTTQAMAARLGPGPFLACFAGGVIQQGGVAFQARVEALLRQACPEASRCGAALAPELGAAMMGAHQLGKDIRLLFDRLASEVAA